MAKVPLGKVSTKTKPKSKSKSKNKGDSAPSSYAEVLEGLGKGASAAGGIAAMLSKGAGPLAAAYVGAQALDVSGGLIEELITNKTRRTLALAEEGQRSERESRKKMLELMLSELENERGKERRDDAHSLIGMAGQLRGEAASGLAPESAGLTQSLIDRRYSDVPDVDSLTGLMMEISRRGMEQKPVNPLHTMGVFI